MCIHCSKGDYIRKLYCFITIFRVCLWTYEMASVRFKSWTIVEFYGPQTRKKLFRDFCGKLTTNPIRVRRTYPLLHGDCGTHGEWQFGPNYVSFGPFFLYPKRQWTSSTGSYIHLISLYNISCVVNSKARFEFWGKQCETSIIVQKNITK